MPTRTVARIPRAARCWRVVFAMAAGLTCLSATHLSATPTTDVYATFGMNYIDGVGYTYGFGTFDLANPTGSFGEYSYAWTTLLAADGPVLANLAMQPGTGAMTLQYEFNQYRAISSAGALSGNLGTTSSFFGMSYDTSGGLYAVAPYESLPWLRLNPANGQSLASGTFTGDFFYYSSFGGNLAARPDGGFYFVDEGPYPPQLLRLTPNGNDVITVAIGTVTGTGFDPANSGMSLFTSGTSLYLLQETTLFAVDESTAALTKLGTIAGLPTDFKDFTGAAAMIMPVPEPSTYAMALFGLACGGVSMWRRKRRSRGRSLVIAAAIAFAAAAMAAIPA